MSKSPPPPVGEATTPADRKPFHSIVAGWWPRVLPRLPRQAMAASGGLVAAGGIFQASVFLATVFVARQLGQAELGRYAVANAIGSVIVSGLGGGLPILALRETAARGLSKPFLRKIIEVELLVTASGTAIAAIMGWFILGGERGLALGALAGIAYIMLSQMSLLAAVHAGLRRYRAAASARIGCACMIVLLTVIALASGLGISGTLVALAVAGGVTAGWLVRTAHRLASEDGGPDSAHLFARSRSLIGIGLIYGGYQRIDALVVLAVTSASTAGIYTSAYRMLSPFVLAASGFGTVFLSRLSLMEADDPHWHAVRRRGTVLFALSILPVAGLAFMAMPYLVNMFYGQVFSSAVLPARILLLSVLPYALYIPNAFALNAARRERNLLGVLVVSLVLEVALMMLLAPAYGATGAAWAWVLTECWVLAGIFWALHSLRPMTRSQIG